eukprot:GHVU01025368.1.p1 GENE.GHVU01025368.1~~GHVU01025368.1.p1  ORF type:complete len:246 (-),score=44.92 GHVU01025368.1:610-1347(-)
MAVNGIVEAYMTSTAGVEWLKRIQRYNIYIWLSGVVVAVLLRSRGPSSLVLVSGLGFFLRSVLCCVYLFRSVDDVCGSRRRPLAHEQQQQQQQEQEEQEEQEEMQPGGVRKRLAGSAGDPRGPRHRAKDGHPHHRDDEECHHPIKIGWKNEIREAMTKYFRYATLIFPLGRLWPFVPIAVVLRVGLNELHSRVAALSSESPHHLGCLPWRHNVLYLAAAGTLSLAAIVAAALIERICNRREAKKK